MPKYNSHKTIEHKFINKFIDLFKNKLEKLYIEDTVLINSFLKNQLSDRTLYTLQKKALDRITKEIFNETCSFTSSLYYKAMKKHANHELAHLLNKSQMGNCKIFITQKRLKLMDSQSCNATNILCFKIIQYTNKLMHTVLIQKIHLLPQ